MKSLQRLARAGRVWIWVARNSELFSRTSLYIVVLLNLLFLVFYTSIGQDHEDAVVINNAASLE